MARQAIPNQSLPPFPSLLSVNNLAERGWAACILRDHVEQWERRTLTPRRSETRRYFIARAIAVALSRLKSQRELTRDRLSKTPLGWRRMLQTVLQFDLRVRGKTVTGGEIKARHIPAP
jgi:hypothetical protein